MKLSLICEKDIRKRIVDQFDDLGIFFFQDADLYLVQEGLEEVYMPCVVFQKSNIEGLIALVKNILPPTNGHKLIGLLNEEYCMIDFEDILYIEAYDAKVYCHTVSDTFQLRNTLYKLEGTLPREDFIRISKSFIVNINNVTKIIPWFNRRLLIKFVDSNKEVEVSKNYVSKFKQFLGIR